MSGHRDVPSELDAMIAEELRYGFSDDEEIVENALEQLADHDESAVRAALAAALARRAVEERAWPAVTDCDRLDEAFAALSAEGVVARQSFWCCTSCAIPAITDEMMDEEARGAPVRGYVYFHDGALHNAVSGYTLGLECGGTIADGDAVPAQVAERVLHALKRAGLDPRWSGGRVVDVAIDWKRRRGKARSRDVTPVEAHVTAWEGAFAAACSAEIPSSFPVELGPALVAADAGELAARWAARSGVTSAATRTARALVERGDDARAREVLLAAYRRHPSVARRFDNRLTAMLTSGPASSYIELLLRGGLDDDVVARVAATRVSRLPPTLHAAAAKAWLACAMRDAARPISPHEEERWIGGARVVWSQDEERPLDAPDAGDARVMLASALWAYLPSEEVAAYADAAFAWLDEDPDEQPSSLARRATFRAATIDGHAADHVGDVSRSAAFDLLEEMIASGVADEARPLLEKLDGDERTLALIALGELPPVDLDATNEALDAIKTRYDEGLLISSERERSQVVALHALAASGDPEAAAALLFPMLEEPIAACKEAVAATRASLEQAAGASFAIDWEARAPGGSTEAWTPTLERRLTRALEQLDALGDRGGWETRSQLRSVARSLVKLAPFDRARSSKILDEITDRWPASPSWWAEIVEVLMAVGRLDEALALDRSPPASRSDAGVSLKLARRLLLAGRSDDALERAVACMDVASTWVLLETSLLLLTLAPAERRPAVAARLRAAYDRAVVALDELTPGPAGVR